MATIDSFAWQMVGIKHSMVENRKNINSAVGEVNKLYSDMSNLIDL